MSRITNKTGRDSPALEQLVRVAVRLVGCSLRNVSLMFSLDKAGTGGNCSWVYGRKRVGQRVVRRASNVVAVTLCSRWRRAPVYHASVFWDSLLHELAHARHHQQFRWVRRTSGRQKPWAERPWEIAAERCANRARAIVARNERVRKTVMSLLDDLFGRP